MRRNLFIGLAGLLGVGMGGCGHDRGTARDAAPSGDDGGSTHDGSLPDGGASMDASEVDGGESVAPGCDASTPCLPTVEPIAAACVDTSSGTSLPGGIGDDATTAVMPLPFPFGFFGATETHYSVSSNGLLQVWPSAAGTPNAAYANEPIPTNTPPNNMIAALWDDLGDQATTTLRALQTGSSPDRIFVVEWGHYLGIGESGGDLTFQVWLYERTNVIEIHYCNLVGGVGTGVAATVGIEDATGTIGVQVGMNTIGLTMTGSGYRFTP